MPKCLFVLFAMATLLSPGAFGADPENPFGNCLDKDERRSTTPPKFKVQFKAPLELKTNASGNFSLEPSHLRQFGCDILSKDQVLSGEYHSAEGLYLVVRDKPECSHMTNYALTQFVDPTGKPVFRIQCSRLAYEDQDPIRCIPDSQDVRDLMAEWLVVQLVDRTQSKAPFCHGPLSPEDYEQE